MYSPLMYTALFSGIIPLVVLFFKKRAFDFKEPITTFVWLTFIATLYEGVFSFILKIDTAYWFLFFPLLEIVALSSFFHKLFKTRHRKIVASFFVVTLVIYCNSFFFWSEDHKFVSLAMNKVPITLFIFTFSFLWFKEQFQKMEIKNPWQYSDFYFVSGLVVYYSTTFFLFLLSNFIFESALYFNDFWRVNVIATLLLRTFLIIGVWKMKQV